MPRRSRTSSRSTPSRASSRARTGGRSRSTWSSSKSPPPPVPRSTLSNQPTPQKGTPAPPPKSQQAQQGSAMGGFMANVASTGLGVMAGRAMDRAFFGGESAGSTPEVISEPADDTYRNSALAQDIPETVCAREALEFKKCMERNSSDVASCQWNLDILASCQRQHQESGYADGGRM